VFAASDAIRFRLRHNNLLGAVSVYQGPQASDAFSAMHYLGSRCILAVHVDGRGPDLVLAWQPDVAKESAAVTLVQGDLRGIVRARRLSAATMRNIRQNLVFAFGYNAAGIPLAAGLLFPVTGWLSSPMLAAAAMSLSSACVIGNALRLRAAKLRGG
jgi:hypothetical protein